MNANEIWKQWESFAPFELRAHRFREEMRPLLFHYLGIAPDSSVLDCGCGTGVFGRYLAHGMEHGSVTGFDINEGAIEAGRALLREQDLSAKVSLEVADGYHLPYADGAFDAVTNYTYLGVLSDPEAGLREMIRACRPGGIVSCVAASNSMPLVQWHGDLPIEGISELHSLSRREGAVFFGFAQSAADFDQSDMWDAFRYPKLFELCGLRDVRMNPFSHVLCYDDERLPFDLRRALALEEAEEDIGWISSRYASKRAIYNAHGFSDDDCARLVELLRHKADYLKEHFGEAKTYAWHGGMNFIVTGTRAQLAD